MNYRKKILMALGFISTATTTIFGANPFVDVPRDSWAYQSVVTLADAGIIQGVNGSYFQGNRAITRYEAAELVAKALAHEDKATVEQRALISKLSDEYADELKQLGVSVTELEQKVGNVRLYGDGRLRYCYQGGNRENDTSWDARVRLRAEAKVNDYTTVTYGINANPYFANNDAASAGTGDITTDIAKVDAQLGHTHISVGRDSYYLGSIRSAAYNNSTFDRVELQYQTGPILATAGYGKFKDTMSYTFPDGNFYNIAGNNTYKLDGLKTGYGEIEYFFDNKSSLGVYYNSFSRAGGSNGNSIANAFAANKVDPDYVIGAYASVALQDDWNVLINYEKEKRDGLSLNYLDGKTKVQDPVVWTGILKYKQADLTKRHSWDAWLEYLNADDGAFLGTSTNSWRFLPRMDNYTSWSAGFDYVIDKNVLISVAQSFASKTKAGTQLDPKEQTLAQVYVTF